MATWDIGQVHYTTDSFLRLTERVLALLLLNRDGMLEVTVITKNNPSAKGNNISNLDGTVSSWIAFLPSLPKLEHAIQRTKSKLCLLLMCFYEQSKIPIVGINKRSEVLFY